MQGPGPAWLALMGQASLAHSGGRRSPKDRKSIGHAPPGESAGKRGSIEGTLSLPSRPPWPPISVCDRGQSRRHGCIGAPSRRSSTSWSGPGAGAAREAGEGPPASRAAPPRRVRSGRGQCRHQPQDQEPREHVTVENGSPSTEPLHRALGLTDDERDEVGGHPRPAAQPSRAGPVRRHVERALLLQVVAGPPQAPAHRGARTSWSVRGRTPGSSTPATASPWPSASRATTIPRPSSPTRARPPGSGGILRDIFTMGARPIAVMDPLFFGHPDDARQPLADRGRGGGHLRATATRSACPRSAAS